MTSFRAYLLGIARNKVRMHFRRAPLVARETELAEEPASSMVNYSSVVARRDEQRLLLLALGDLDEDEAIAVELHYWQGLTIVEIAEALSIPPGTVKTRLMRARKVLAKSIQRHAKSADLAQSTIGDLDRWARSLQSDGSGTGS
jgi:RNA polymerase sigma-70 factor (ECF subfamily)